MKRLRKPGLFIGLILLVILTAAISGMIIWKSRSVDTYVYACDRL